MNKTRFEEIVLGYVNKYDMFGGSDHILLGLSGGGDSSALLHFLSRRFPKIRITAAHMNHMIREKPVSDGDEDFSRRIAAENGADFISEKADVKKISREKKISAELAAREVRYGFFTRAAALTNPPAVIVTAHTASDNSETVLYNISRGTGLAGLAGIPPVSYMRGLKIVRPFLCLNAEEIELYRAENGIECVEDQTNADQKYTRNFFRHSITAPLRERFPALDRNILRMGENIRRDNSFLDRAANEYVSSNKITPESGAASETLSAMDSAVRRRVIRLMFELAWTGAAMAAEMPVLEQIHTDAAENLIMRGKNANLDLPCGFSASLSFGKFFISRKPDARNSESPAYARELGQGLNEIPETGIKITLSFEGNKISSKTSENVYNLLIQETVDFDKIIGRIFVKKRLEKDEYRFNGQTKNIRKNYINRKIPKELRERLPIFHDDDGIFLAAGLPPADRVKIEQKNANTKKLYIIIEDL